MKTLAEEELASIKVEPKQQSSKITRLQIEVAHTYHPLAFNQLMKCLTNTG